MARSIGWNARIELVYASGFVRSLQDSVQCGTLDNTRDDETDRDIYGYTDFSECYETSNRFTCLFVRHRCLLLVFLACTGCERIVANALPSYSTFHQKIGLKAEDYFDDPKVIKLCHAIEANDLDKMDQLIADGVDVNAKGKDNVTLVLGLL